MSVLRALALSSIPIILLVLAATSSSSADTILWSDEFSGPAGAKPDPNKWSSMEGQRFTSQELQYYVRDAATLDGDGHLVLTAQSAGASRIPCYQGPCRFTSGRLVSRFKGLYGRFEARVRTSAVYGASSFFRMLGDNFDDAGWPDCGSIDVMEALASRPDTVGGAAHGPGYSGDKALSHRHRLDNGSSADGFHVVSVDWGPDSLTWSVDGVVYATVLLDDHREWVFDHPFFMMLSLAVGGTFGDQPPSDDNFTATFVVDYVRVYAHGGAAAADGRFTAGIVTVAGLLIAVVSGW